MNQEIVSSAVAKACSTLRDISLAKATHNRALKLGSLSNPHNATHLLNAYCKCGLIDNARQLFDEIPQRILDVVCWNSIISGFVKNASYKEAFQYFNKMQRFYTDGVSDQKFGFDSYTLSSLLSSTHCLEEDTSAGEQLHCCAIKSGVFSTISVGNSLITLYARRGRLLDANRIFDTMPQKNIISWTALISGHAQHGHGEESLRLFLELMRNGYKPNQFTFALIFSSCGEWATLSQGTILISPALKMGYVSDIHVQNSLVSFYSVCGCLEDAEAIFKTITEPDTVSWNSLLKGYSQQGYGKQALVVFKEMCNMGFLPDSITFLTVVSACKNSAMVTEGLLIFKTMVQDYKIMPEPEHIACIVSLFGRAGRIREAMELIKSTRFECGASVWRTLLGACRIHGNVDVAEMAAEQLFRIGPHVSETYTVLSNIYAENGRWDMVARMRCLMKEKKVYKEPGLSWIEVGNKMHCFYAAGTNHPRVDEMEAMLMELANNM